MSNPTIPADEVIFKLARIIGSQALEIAKLQVEVEQLRILQGPVDVVIDNDES